MSALNRSGYKGVRPNGKRWQAKDSKGVYGTFDTPHEAACALADARGRPHPPRIDGFTTPAADVSHALIAAPSTNPSTAVSSVAPPSSDDDVEIAQVRAWWIAEWQSGRRDFLERVDRRVLLDKCVAATGIEFTAKRFNAIMQQHIERRLEVSVVRLHGVSTKIWYIVERMCPLEALAARQAVHTSEDLRCQWEIAQRRIRELEQRLAAAEAIASRKEELEVSEKYEGDSNEASEESEASENDEDERDEEQQCHAACSDSEDYCIVQEDDKEEEEDSEYVEPSAEFHEARWAARLNALRLLPRRQHRCTNTLRDFRDVSGVCHNPAVPDPDGASFGHVRRCLRCSQLPASERVDDDPARVDKLLCTWEFSPGLCLCTKSPIPGKTMCERHARMGPRR
jgi:hypothetical protein